MTKNKKDHWEDIYSNTQSNEVSWTQDTPKASLSFIHSYKLPKNAKIIDVGGGDSKLVDFLLAEGYQNITVLDISAKSLERAAQRLGDHAAKVKWIVTDVLAFSPVEKYDVWHDRATFHFLTKTDQIVKYIDLARRAINGYLTIGTFSENGPNKCSGLDIKQYSEGQLQDVLATGFRKIRCIKEDHTTPFNTTQNFLYCSFKKL